MIDFYLQIIKNKKNGKSIKPYSLLNNYKKYTCIENELSTQDFYYYTNSFNQLDYEQSFFENEHHYFFLIGQAFYRNNICIATKCNLTIQEVYTIVINNTEFHKTIKGNYAFITIKKSNLSIHLTNSPLGVIPINYAIIAGIVYISSNLTFIMNQLDSPKINKAALIQVSLFDTILGSNTLVEKIKQLQYGQTIKIDDNNILENQYYKHSSLLGHCPRRRKDSLSDIIETLNKNICLLPINNPFLMGLTGGYDCRLNFGLIPESVYENITAYTYGMSTSPEIKIASFIAKKFKLCYKEIILEEDFEREYVANADEVLFLGDGFTPFMRVNYYYAHRSLSEYARNCLTGMYGSEFIKPMHVMPDSVSINPATVSAFFSMNTIDSLVEYFRNSKNSKDAYFRQKVFSEAVLEETIELIRSKYISGQENLTKEERIFNFYLNEGMRKFFMEIIRIDRMFINHHLPFLDIDFIELLLSTQYAGVYNNIFNESLIKRRKGQLLYVDVLNTIKPELNNIVVDRGYKPKYLKNKMGWAFVSTGYIFGKKLRKLIKGNTTFNTKKWRSMVYLANLSTLQFKSELFSDMLLDGYDSGFYLKNEHTFGKHYSLKKWIQSNNLLS